MTQEAQRRPQQLTQAFAAAGLRLPPDPDIIVRSLGTDGGAVCDNPASALRSGDAARLDDQRCRLRRPPPVIVDSRILVGEALILLDVLPGEAAGVPDKSTTLKFDDMIEA